jgi:hypothetical protein
LRISLKISNAAGFTLDRTVPRYSAAVGPDARGGMAAAAAVVGEVMVACCAAGAGDVGAAVGEPNVGAALAILPAEELPNDEPKPLNDGVAAGAAAVVDPVAPKLPKPTKDGVDAVTAGAAVLGESNANPPNDGVGAAGAGAGVEPKPNVGAVEEAVALVNDPKANEADGADVDAAAGTEADGPAATAGVTLLDQHESVEPPVFGKETDEGAGAPKSNAGVAVAVLDAAVDDAAEAGAPNVNPPPNDGAAEEGAAVAAAGAPNANDGVPNVGGAAAAAASFAGAAVDAAAVVFPGFGVSHAAHFCSSSLFRIMQQSHSQPAVETRADIDVTLTGAAGAAVVAVEAAVVEADEAAEPLWLLAGVALAALVGATMADITGAGVLALTTPNGNPGAPSKLTASAAVSAAAAGVGAALAPHAGAPKLNDGTEPLLGLLVEGAAVAEAGADVAAPNENPPVEEGAVVTAEDGAAPNANDGVPNVGAAAASFAGAAADAAAVVFPGLGVSHAAHFCSSSLFRIMQQSHSQPAVDTSADIEVTLTAGAAAGVTVVVEEAAVVGAAGVNEKLPEGAADDSTVPNEVVGTAAVVGAPKTNDDVELLVPNELAVEEAVYPPNAELV